MDDRIRGLEAEVARLQAELAEMERRALGPELRSLADYIPDNVILIDRQLRIRYINWTVAGLSMEEVLGRPVYEFAPEAYRELSRATHERAFVTGEPQRLETEYGNVDGSVTRWLSRTVPIRNAQGQYDRAMMINTDVTERHEAARERDRFFELSLDMLCVGTLSGRFKRVSPSFTTVLGWSPAELLETPFLEFVHPDDRAATRVVMDALGRGERVVDFENRYRMKGGGYKVLQWGAIADLGNALVYAMARDVTERRELEAELRQSRRMESIGQLAGGVAHDFNNLILAIDANAEMARRVQDDGRRAEHLLEVQNCASRAAQLTRQLLLLGRKEPPLAVPLELGALMTDIHKMLERTFPANLRIEVEDRAPGARVLADRSQMEQVLLNLCVNARDAMPDGGLLTLRIERGAESSSSGVKALVLSVQDNGSGMTPEIVERIFEPFFTTKPRGSGTGLGLSTVYGIVRQHGGSVRVASEPGRGSCFRVLLPETDAPLELPVSTPVQIPTRVNETILVAEDFDQVRRVVVTVLEQAGYRVLEARDGEEALEIVRAQGGQVDLALLDVIMPGMSGPEVAEQARRLEPALRVLFTSGYSEIPSSGADIPEDQLVRKPYRAPELLARVRRALL